MVVVTQRIDLGGPVGRMVASALFGLAEIDFEFRRERHIAGISVAKQRGVYRRGASSTFKAIPTRTVEQRDRGLTIKEIATALGVSERTEFRYLNVAAWCLGDALTGLLAILTKRLEYRNITILEVGPNAAHGRLFL